MRAPLRPIDEARRLDALRHFRVLDTPPEQALDDLTALAAHICETPIALVSLVDEHRQWFKSKVGLQIGQSPRAGSFCEHLIDQPDVLIVPDATDDERFATSPLVTGDFHIRFYAGAPLVTLDGQTLGTLCVMDRVPRRLSPAQTEALRVLGRQVAAHLELGRHRRELAESEARLRAATDNAGGCQIGQAAAIQAQPGPEFRALFSANPLPMWMYDLTTLRFLEVNDAAVERYGYKRSEFLAMTIKDIRPAADLDRLLADLGRPQGASQRAVTWRHRLKSGRIIDVEVTSHRITLAGRSAGLVAAHDITKRRHAEEAQQTSEGRYRALFEYAPDGIVVADRESYYIDVNASMCRMLGYSRDEFIGLHASDIVVSSEVAHIKPALQAITNASDYHREWLFKRKDGSVFPADVFATMMPDGNLLGMVRDVTDRNKAVEAVRTAEERMRFALQSACVGIWDLDYTTGLLQWSEMLETQYGLEPGTFGGTFAAFVECVHPDDRAAVVETFANAAKTGTDFTMNHRSVWPDGTVRWLSGSGRVHLGEHGEAVRAVGISMDVTGRRTLEEQFQQAQKMEAIGRLAGGVAHDFNNLLTVILGYCELLLADLEPEDRRQGDIAEIQKAGARGAGLTRQLLAFSRKEIIAPTWLDLNAVVGEMRAMLGRLIGEDIKVVVSLSPGLAPVFADRGQVDQIVMNLAVNARDAMPRGGSLTIETANIELDEHYAQTHFAVVPGPYVSLTVTDTGTGIAPDVQARLFEPFFTTKEPGKGTGLGLATVHGIVTRSGGSIHVHSAVGTGTSFTVYFPRADEGEMAVAAPPAEARPRAGALTVLVVEDADGLRALTERLLERLGYTVLVAANAGEAREVFARNPSVDVLLTDVVMPGGSGPELTSHLVELRPGLKVIYMSGYTEDAVVHHGILNPGIAFLHKPFTSETLGQKIRDAFDR